MKLNLTAIAKDAGLLKTAQRKVRAGQKLTRAETAALKIEVCRLEDIILSKMAVA